MSPKEVVSQWIKFFNDADADSLSDLYSEHAINHQVVNDPVVGKGAIKKMFSEEFARADMVCLIENLFEDGEWAILEWKDPQGMRGCGFFHVQQDKINFQRGYWDKESFNRLHGVQ